MRTTVDIPDQVYRRLKIRAASQGCSVKELVLRGVEAELGERKRARNRERIALPLKIRRSPGGSKSRTPKSMKSYFPDINVWLAVAYRGHRHHPIAAAWFEQVGAEQAILCRLTQLGLLRLLTMPAVMREDVKSQRGAWDVYDRFMSDERVTFYPEAEPERIESMFRQLTATPRFAPQQWPDAYLAAFARCGNLTLVTFDKALGKLSGSDALLLQ